MNGQPDINLFRLMTENPEFMQKAISIASSLASSGILSGQFGQQNTNGQSNQSYGGYQQEQPSQNGYTDSKSDGASPANILQGLDLARLFSQTGGTPPRKDEAVQSNGDSYQGKESSVSGKDGKEASFFAKASHAERIRLLEAMRPFVPEHRREKLDFVIRLMGLIEVADKLGLKNIIEGR